jgi:hypothetical protein
VSVAGVPDLDADGKGDLVIGDGRNSQAYVFSGGTGLFQRLIQAPTTVEGLSEGLGYASTIVPDVNGNGIPEIAAMVTLYSSTPQRRIVLLDLADSSLIHTWVSPDPDRDFDLGGIGFPTSISSVPDGSGDQRGDIVVRSDNRAYVYWGGVGVPLAAVLLESEFPPLQAHESATVTVSFLNLGERNWSEDTQIRLASQVGINPLSMSDRMYLAPGTSVAPGSVAEFHTEFNAPRVAGIYENRWRLVQEGNQHFGPEVNVPVSVSGGLDGYISIPFQSRPSTLFIGEPPSGFLMIVTNTGEETWPNGPYRAFDSTAEFGEWSSPVYTSFYAPPDTGPPRFLPPGSEIHISGSIRAPAETGVYLVFPRLRTDDGVVFGRSDFWQVIVRSRVDGDATADGTLDSGDIVRVINHMSGNQGLSGDGLANADVNNDKIVDSTDAQLIVDLLLGRDN